MIVPFGGGGLICGIGSVMRRLRPTARMIVAESEAAQPAAAALRHGGPVKVPHRQSFIDGMGSTTVLEEMWPRRSAHRRPRAMLSASSRVVTSTAKNWALSSPVRILSKEHGAT